MAQLVVIAGFGIIAIGFGATVFRTSSMVRSALALLGAMVAIGLMFLTLEAEFLGVLQLMMMAGEMTIMAIFMVMYMMDPGGLGQMDMSHQKRFSKAAAAVAFGAATALVLLAEWGEVIDNAPAPDGQVRELGLELMGRSLLVFEAAGTSILVAMIAATSVAIASRR